MTTNPKQSIDPKEKILASNGGRMLAASSSIEPPVSSMSTCLSSIIPPRGKLPSIVVDPGILCFHHCSVKVFCFTLPSHCPQCKKSLNQDPCEPAVSVQILNDGDHNYNYCTQTHTHNSKNNKAEANHKSVYNDDIDVQYEQQQNSAEQDVVEDDNNDYNYNNDNTNADGNAQQQNGFVATVKNASNDCRRSRMNGRRLEFMEEQRLLPFRLPFPFVRASQHPCSIVLRPTIGDFLNDYNNTTDLHIAVTDSQGSVVEFDRHGLRRHPRPNTTPLQDDEWRQSLLVVADIPEPWHDYWDQILHEVCSLQPDKWSVARYHEDHHNCYSFVLSFLQRLQYGELSMAASSKQKFCERYIVPRTTTAGKYISLYRKLRSNDIYVHHQTNAHYKKFMKRQLQQLEGGGDSEQLNGSYRRMGKVILPRITNYNISERLQTQDSQDSKLNHDDSPYHYHEEQQQQQQQHYRQHPEYYNNAVDDLAITGGYSATGLRSNLDHGLFQRTPSNVIGNKNGYMTRVTSAQLLNSARSMTNMKVLCTIEE